MKQKIYFAFKRLLAPFGFTLGDITYETESTTQPNGSILERFLGYKVIVYLKTYTIKARSIFIFKEEEIDKKLMSVATEDSLISPSNINLHKPQDVFNHKGAKIH